jgi:hypothetical protein
MKMPRPPKPNAGRAIVGFVIGLVIGLIVVGIVRLVQGLGMFLVDVHIMDRLFTGWFWDDEASFMFGMLFGALGFIWGAGALYDFSHEAEPSRAIKPRIPLDPDAPRITTNPAMALIGSIPSLGMATMMLVVTIVVLVVIIASGLGSSQVTNEAADPNTFGTSDFNFLGLIKVEDVDQVQLFVVFSVLVLGGVVTTGIFIAMIVWLLNRQINTAAESKPEPSQGEAFLPIRLIAFFTDWVLDILDGVKGIVTPR